MTSALAVLLAFSAFFLIRYLVAGLFTVDQNERAVLTSFGKAHRLGKARVIDGPLAESIAPEERDRYDYPQVEVIGPGGPYFKFPWQKVHKVNIAIQTMSIAFDPEDPSVNAGGQVLEAVTKDQLNIGMTGQIRHRPAEENFYAYLFGVKSPIAHVMGYFISILRERIATFADVTPPVIPGVEAKETPMIEGVSINDLRKNLNALNVEMDRECLSSGIRYGIQLDASLITGIDPPADIESALAAINTAHNEVSANISVAQAMADQTIEQSKRAVEIETLKAEAEVKPIRALAEQLAALRDAGPRALAAFIRNVRLELYQRARRVYLEEQR
jgi:regulator of protease activity HflC (stomatin/prohibitin superfamily)